MASERIGTGRVTTGRNIFAFGALLALVAALFVLPPSLFDAETGETVIAPRREAPTIFTSTGAAGATATRFALPAPHGSPGPAAEVELPAVPFAQSYARRPDPVFAPLEAGPLEVCATRLDLIALPQARVHAEVASPCYPLAPVRVQMDGLSVPMRLNVEGRGEVTLPALAPLSRAWVMHDNRVVAEAEAPQVDLAAQDRVVAIWPADLPGLQLHLYVDGARTGEPGHVWVVSTPSPGSPDAERFGALSHIGPIGVPGPVVESYVLPPGARLSDGRVQVFAAVAQSAALCRPNSPRPTLIFVEDGQVQRYRLRLSDAVCNPFTGRMPTRVALLPILVGTHLIAQAEPVPES